VIIPTSRSPSTTGSEPTSFDLISSAASRAVVLSSTVVGLEVIASRIDLL
jgi:hypothetical protein